MKKIFTTAIASLAVAAMLVIGTGAVDFSVSPAATGEVLGDANGDGSINAKDVLSIKRAVVSIESAEVGADANADGKLNAKDVLAVKRSIVGIEALEDLPGNNIRILAVEGTDVRNMAIVAPADTSADSDNSAWAAEQLRKYLSLSAGYSRSVEYGTASTAHAIYIVCDPTWDGESWSGGDLRTEDFIIEVKDGDVYITGGFMRGCMYGVYEFLEEYVGWRFLVSDDYLYDADIINLKNGIYDEQTPVLNFRSVGIDYDNEVGYKLKINSAGGNYASDRAVGYVRNNYFANAHSFAYYKEDMWPFEQYTNPEYSKRVDQLNYNWQPCFSKDYDEMFQGMLRMNEMTLGWGKVVLPGQVCMSFSIMDNNNYCQCADCRELYSRMGVSGASIQFASRAADELQEYYPGVEVYTILYDKTPPADEVYVSEYLVIMYCGTGCNNHVPGTGECGDGLTTLGTSNAADEESFPAWAKVCSNLRFWAYEITYSRTLAPCPNVFNIIGDIRFVVNSGGVGINHEAGGGNYFEELKAYLSARVMWDTDMTDEEYEYTILEYLYFTYGEGYEEIYRILELMDDAGNAVGCFINNHDYPLDMYSLDVLDTQYEEILQLLGTAREGCQNDTQLERFDKMSMSPYFLALSGAYDRVYVNGTDEAAKQEYADIYQYVYSYLKDNNIIIFDPSSAWPLPSTCNLDKNPMYQFYGTGYSGQ